MKNKPFIPRLLNAWGGILSAFRSERSFRTQLILGAGAVVATAIVSPALIWWAAVVIMLALVWAAELFNTALEHALDGLHPSKAPFIRIAKDCAAAAVLTLSLASVVVFGLMLKAEGIF